jgi:hypothetical protein
MTAMTTNNSTSVNPCPDRPRTMDLLLGNPMVKPLEKSLARNGATMLDAHETGPKLTGVDRSQESAMRRR